MHRLNEFFEDTDGYWIYSWYEINIIYNLMIFLIYSSDMIEIELKREIVRERKREIENAIKANQCSTLLLNNSIVWPEVQNSNK